MRSRPGPRRCAAGSGCPRRDRLTTTSTRTVGRRGRARHENRRSSAPRAASAAPSAIGLGQRGATVALLARRHDRLVDAAKEAGPGALAIECDVTDAASCHDGDRGGGRGAGRDRCARLRHRASARWDDWSTWTPTTWRRTFDTNVVGAALITAAAIPHLTESRGVAAYLSSVSGSLTPPWPGLGAYAASKAALGTWSRPGGPSTRPSASPGSSSATAPAAKGTP